MEKSRVEWILRYGLGEVSTLPPRLSRIEKLLVELIQQGSGGDITVDDELSPTSENPVQNKVLDSIINGTGSGSVYSKIMLAIAEVVAEAPEDFDTLKEISDWISHHEDSAAAMNSAIQANATAIAGKVDKVSGKGLSTNDYTTEEKTKLASISANASDVGKLYPDSDHGEIFNDYKNNVASGWGSHSEGVGTTASGPASHAEGNSTTASSADAHAEGGNTTASGLCSHAEGYTTIASGRYSHTEGMGTSATGECSHSEGLGTWACGGQHVQGRYNKHDTSYKYSFIIGNGRDSENRSDAFAVDWNGLIYQNNSATGIDLFSLSSTVDNKVDKISGKGLSTNDYTTEEKNKLAGIETGAKVNIQPDWEQSDNTADDFIKNKPTLGSAASRSVVLSLSNADSGLPTSGTVYSALQNKVDKVTGKGLSTEDYTTEEKTKLASIEEGATKTIVDTNLSSTSTNPVQNKIINSALANYIPLSGSSAIAGKLIPITSNNIDFGSSDKYWNKAYVTKIIIGSYSMNIRTYDCDTAIDSGHYIFYGSGKTSNLPSTAGDSEFGILVVYRSGEYCIQIVYMLGKKTAHIRYTDNVRSNPFTSWVQIFSFSS